MTTQINKPELEALIEKRLKAGCFRNVEDLLLFALGGGAAPEEPAESQSDRNWLVKEEGVWVLHTGQQISPTIVEETLDEIRRERDLANLGLLR